MPNWTKNHVIIKADKDTIAKIKSLVTTEKNAFSLNAIVPMPEKLPEAKDGKFPAWYDWCVENWGTKWETREAKFIRGGVRVLHYKFYTAWADPGNALEALSKLFPTATITNEAEYEGGWPIESATYVYREGYEVIPAF